MTGNCGSFVRKEVAAVLGRKLQYVLAVLTRLNRYREVTCRTWDLGYPACLTAPTGSPHCYLLAEFADLSLLGV